MIINNYLSLEQTENLTKLGFKSDYPDPIAEKDYFLYNNEVWVLGGCYFNPKHTGFLVPDHVWKQGKRLISVDDLIQWTEKRVPYEIKKNKNQYWQGYLFVSDGSTIELTASTLIDILYELTCKALEVQPSLNDYETEPAYEIIEMK